MRCLGIDYGKRYVGLAVSDVSGLISNPLKVIKIKNEDSFIKKILPIIKEKNVEKIIFGYPISLDNSEGPAAIRMTNLINRLKKKVDIPIIKWDERFSTVNAEKYLFNADVKRKNFKKKIDSVAASLILQDYLNSIREKNNNEV